MNAHPFRLAQPLSRILHGTMLQRIRETEQSLALGDVDSLYTYAMYDHAPHAQMLTALNERFGAVRQYGEAALSSDRLFFPLRAMRRGLSAIQHFPNTEALEDLKSETELSIVQDVLRLSTDDLSSTDVSFLWSGVVQCSRWDCVETLLDHFPLRQTLEMQDAHEFRELVLWVCFCHHVSTVKSSNDPTGTQTVDHAQQLLMNVLGLEETMQRCRADLEKAPSSSSSDPTAGAGNFGGLGQSAFACATLVGMLRRRCGMNVDFPVSEEEWARWVHADRLSVSSASSRDGGAPSTAAIAAGTSRHNLQLRHSISVGSFPAWCRRVAVLHSPGVPEYVQTAFHSILADDLHRLYQRREADGVALFFITVLPMLCKSFADVELRRQVRHYHNVMMSELFWNVAAAAGSTTTATASHGKRGKWTPDASQRDAKAMDGGSGSSAAPASATAVSFSLPPEVALNLLVGEVCIQAPDEPLPPSHIPAVEKMLQTVLEHLRAHMQPESTRRGGVRGGLAGAETPTSSSSSSLPLTLWRSWHVVQSSHLAIVLSRLLREKDHHGGASSGSPTLDRLLAQGLSMLRPLISMAVLQERGTAVAVTHLLVAGRAAAVAVGGSTYEAQLRALTVEHLMDGFARDQLETIRAAEVRACEEGKSEAERAAALHFISQLEDGVARLPLRKWG